MLNGALIYAKYPPKEPVMEPGTIVVSLSLPPSIPLSLSLSWGHTMSRCLVVVPFLWLWLFLCFSQCICVCVQERFKSVGVARHVVYTQI